MIELKDIKLIHSRRRGLLIKAIGNGMLEVRAPLGTLAEEVLSKLNEFEAKIRKLQENYERKHQKHSYEDGSTVLLKGEPITISYVDNTPYAWRYADKHLIIKSKYKAYIHPLLKDFYTEQAKSLIHRALELGLEHGFPKVRFSLRWNKSRWGSYSSRGAISLNCALIMAPQDVIDYVIIHEYCHAKHPNHSAAFWSCVENLMPDFRIQYSWLKEHGHLLRIAEQSGTED